MRTMTTINRLRVLAVDGPRLTLHADHVCGGLTSDKNLLPSYSLALGFLMETTIDSYIEIEHDGVLECTPPGWFQSSPLAQALGGRCGVGDPWVWAVAGRFISCVGVTDRRNCDAWWDCNHEGWKDPTASRKERPSAAYHIATTDPRWLVHLAPGMEWDSMAFDLGHAHGETLVVDPSWRTRVVMGLAAAIDAELAFDRLPILADALEDAGCADTRLLAHCRGPGPHVDCCWALAAVLGMLGER
jgi:hypothetical protein